MVRSRNSRHTMMCVVVGALFAGLGVGRASSAEAQEEETTPAAPVFELRTYTAVDGKLPQVLDRFRKGETAIFTKNGIQTVGFWVPADPPLAANTLIYILAHQSLDGAKTAWERFAGDPLWRSLRTRTEAGGPLVARVESVFMSAHGAVAEVSGATPVYELRTYAVGDGQRERLVPSLEQAERATAGKKGMGVVGMWAPVDPSESKRTVIVLLRHESVSAAKASRDRAKADQRVNRLESVFMRSTDFSPMP